VPGTLLADALTRYLTSSLGTEVRGEAWTEERRLSLMMRQAYRPWVADLYGHPCLFLLAAGALDAPRIVAKHLAVVRNAWQGNIAVVAATMTPHLRRALLSERIPFVVPGSQLHLPFLGLLLTERFKAPKSEVKVLRPATQAVLLWWIHHGFAVADTARALTQHLGYTAMSLSRAYDELEQLAAAIPALRVERVGRERKAGWTGNAQALWTAVQPHLRNPVRRRRMISCADPPPGLLAGLSGLARWSDLVDPDVRVLAIDHDTWMEFSRAHRHGPGLPGEPDAIQVEVWCHACDLHWNRQEARPVTADPLAIALTFSGTPEAQDDRVEAALHRLVAEHAWRW
jgi:hypothetical protein